MAMTAKVENYCTSQRDSVQIVHVDRGTRACINCIWYEQYHRQNRGNVRLWVPVDAGHCILHDRQRGPLRGACKDYETE